MILRMHYKINLIICFFIISFLAKAQERDSKSINQDYNLYVSGGIHAGIWSMTGLEEMPYTLHIDKIFNNGFCLGAGYSYDHYTRNILAGEVSSVRQNIRLRFLWYLKDRQNESFSTYLGFSTGLSAWSIDPQPSYNKMNQSFNVPSIQLIYGMKMKINETMYWITEFGLGAPYMAQTSIGFKF
jgi:hypothetical protein